MTDAQSNTDNGKRKAGRKTLGKIKIAAIAGIVGLALGIVGTLLFMSPGMHKSDNSLPSPSIVFERIQQKSELVSASQEYSIVDKVSNTATFFDMFDIPFTTNSFWYKYVGTIKAGVNLENAVFEEGGLLDGTTITVTLNQPYIISNTPDMDKSGVMEERNNIFNQIHIDAVDEFQRQCIETSQAEAIAGGLFDEARINAEQDITDMFNAAFGDVYTIEFIWREAQN